MSILRVGLIIEERRFENSERLRGRHFTVTLYVRGCKDVCILLSLTHDQLPCLSSPEFSEVYFLSNCPERYSATKLLLQAILTVAIFGGDVTVRLKR